MYKIRDNYNASFGQTLLVDRFFGSLGRCSWRLVGGQQTRSRASFEEFLLLYQCNYYHQHASPQNFQDFFFNYNTASNRWTMGFCSWATATEFQRGPSLVYSVHRPNQFSSFNGYCRASSDRGGNVLRPAKTPIPCPAVVVTRFQDEHNKSVRIGPFL